MFGFLLAIPTAWIGLSGKSRTTHSQKPINMDISVVIPLFNEEESIPELYSWIERVINAHGFTYEVIFVNDGQHRPFLATDEDLQEKLICVEKASNSSRTNGKKPRLNIAASRKRRATWSSPWTPTFRTPPTRYRNFTV